MPSLTAVSAISAIFLNNLNTLSSSTEFINDSADFLPQLHLDASSDVEILRKFPFLTTLKAMANALEEAGVIASSQQNPHSYDKYTMAEKVFEYLNKHLDFATGKAPTVIQTAYEAGYIMSQKDFWTNAKGLYTLLEDPGFGATAVSLDSGTHQGGHHYVTAPTNINCNTPTNTGSYHSSPVTAQISATLATNSFIDYADFTNDTLTHVEVDTANTGIDSDDIAGFSFEVSGAQGTDTSGSALALNLHYPFNDVPGGNAGHQKATSTGIAGVFGTTTSQDVNMLSVLTPSEADLTSSGLYGATQFGYTGTITFPSRTNVVSGSPSTASTQGSITHMKPSLGVSSYSRSMSGDGSDVNPEFGLVFPFFDDQPVKWSAPASYTDINLTDLQATDGTAVPSDHVLTAVKVYQNGVLQATLNTDGAEHDWLEEKQLQSWQPYQSGSTTSAITLKLNTTSNKLQIKKRTTNPQLQGWGCAFFDFEPFYTSVSESQPTSTGKRYKVAFHRLCTWNLDFARATPVIKNIGVGVSGNMTANVTDDSGATVGLTGYQGPFSLATVSVSTAGAGYDSGESITCTMPTPAGRYYQNIYGGQNVPGTRSNNNPDIKNAEATADVTVTDGRLAREVEVIYHSTDNFAQPGSFDYRQRGFLGADFNYEKDNFARRFVLNSDNKISSIDTANATPNTTVGTDGAPGYEYDINYYHASQNPHGNNTGYVAHTFGTGEDDERYFSKATGSFDVTVSGGVVTAITPRSRDDAAGTATQGGWNYSSNSDYTELQFYQDPAVSFPSDYVAPFVHIRTTATADNSQGNKATVDITDSELEFYHGKNVPDNAFLYAMAPGSGDKAMAVQPDTDFNLDEWYERNWRPSITPASVRINVERPVLSTESRGLKTKTVGTGAHRYSFEFEYPPMTQTEAEEVLTLFDKFKGATQEIQLNIPKNAIQYLGGIIEDHFISRKPTIVANGSLGSNEIVVDGFQDSGSTSIPVNTHFTIQGFKKIYKVVGTTAPNKYGRAELRIEPPLVGNRTGFYLDTDNFNELGREYFMIRAFVEDAGLDYTIDAAGMYRLSPIRFRESL